ncbi:MAG: SDH family Clp fold serine proteinase [Rudaea sp.]
MPNIDITQLFFLLIIITTIWPMISRWLVERGRTGAIRRLEQKRGSRVITLIHRQESLSFLGLAFARYINIEDSEDVLRAIRLTSSDTPIDLILHTPGGLVLAAEQIAHALVRHKAPVTVFVPHYAMSGGTLIALAADRIVMDPNAVLGPVDPQIGQWPASSILKVIADKPIKDVDDETLILSDIARKAVSQVAQLVVNILTANGMEQRKAEELAETLTGGRWTHDYPLLCDELVKLGLPVSDDLPKEVLQLMELYPQAGARRPSVEYIPLPYPPPSSQPARGNRDKKS